ncbi:MAG: hypothetical protein AB7O47_02850 [Flavobacteriales bacterium]
MDRKDLIDYLNNKLDINLLLHQIKPELEKYKSGLKKIGGSAPIILDGDKGSVNITRIHLEKLKQDLSNNIIDCFFVSYVSDALFLSENSMFESDEIKDDFELLTEYPFN